MAESTTARFCTSGATRELVLVQESFGVTPVPTYTRYAVVRLVSEARPDGAYVDAGVGYIYESETAMIDVPLGVPAPMIAPYVKN